MNSLLALASKQWFLVAYVIVLALALTAPDIGRSAGLLHLGVLKPYLIGGIFLCAGLVLPSSKLGAAIGAWRAHVAIQGSSFVLAPLFGLGLATVLALVDAPVALCAGVLVLACLPTTIGSCVAVTGQAGGNQAIALVNSVLGNLLGIVVTPLLVLWLTGKAGSAPIEKVILDLALLAAAPVVAGQLIRLGLAAWIDAHKPLISYISGSLLLVLIWQLFSEAVHGGMASGLGMALVAAIVFHALMLASAWLLAPLAVQSRPDRIAVVATASQKTAALGIPLVTVLYAGDPNLALLTLPVLLYHVVQMITAASLVGTWKAWATT